MATSGNPICRWRPISALLVDSPATAYATAPMLRFSTHFGGGWNTDVRAIAHNQGNAWLALTTERIDQPVAKIAPSHRSSGPLISEDWEPPRLPSAPLVVSVSDTSSQPVNLGVK